jgi:hypothetical protein
VRETLPVAAVAAVIALILGAAGMYFLMPAEAPSERTPTADPVAINTESGSSSGGSRSKQPDGGDTSAEYDLKKQLAETSRSLGKLSEENSSLRVERDELAKEKKALADEIVELKKRIEDFKAATAGSNRMLVDFGRWSEVKEIRETDWNDLGDAYAKMTPLLKEYADALAQGKEIDPETGAKIKEQNDRLIAFYAKVINKLPTHAGTNGEFTHPINLVNILAGQLAQAGLPLSDEQKQELSKLGAEFDKRWEALEAGYNETTWALQKLVDEADLKQWFYEKMFEVTTAEQRNTAVPPELQGLIGLDLYSPGLMLQGNIMPLREPDMQAMKVSLKASVSEFTAISRETLDGAEYIFDDWLNALQLQPMTQLELGQWRTLPVIKAGKAQLAGLHALDEGVVNDEELRKKFRFMQRIVVPQLVKQE